MRWLLVAILGCGVVGVDAGAAGAADGVRTFQVRDARLRKGESLGIQLHPSEVPIEIESSQPDLEVCPHGWPSFAGFLECLPLEDGALRLPSAVVDTFHLGIRVQGVDGAAVRIEQLKVTYEPGDGYFILQPPALRAGASSPAVVVTPTVRDSVGVGVYGQRFRRPRTDARVDVRQSGRRVRLGGEPSNGRVDGDYGPVELDRPVTITVRNDGSKRATLELVLDWS